VNHRARAIGLGASVVATVMMMQSWALASGVASPSAGQRGDAGIGASVHGGGLRLLGNKSTPERTHGRNSVKSVRVMRFRYSATPACRSNRPDRPHLDATCEQAVTTCQMLGGGVGPMTWLWRLPLQADGAGQAWERYGQSCSVTIQAHSTLTLAMVQRAFRQLDFAKPEVRIQPEGTITLVNLPTYYRVQWPASGLSPAETTTVTILGMNVRVRPTAQSYNYRFGDGARTGPVADPGGIYPTGNITHAYRDKGQVPASVTVTYTADFSVNGGPWQPVRDTVDITGPPTTIQVREARARLEAGSGR
jgi:hypothetical protein